VYKTGASVKLNSHRKIFIHCDEEEQMLKKKSAMLIGLSALAVATSSQAALVTETFNIDFSAAVGGFVDATAYNNAINGNASVSDTGLPTSISGFNDFTRFSSLFSTPVITGTISYDDTVNTISNNTVTGIKTVSQVSVSLTIGSNTYTEVDDANYVVDPLVPLITYNNGALTSLDYVVDAAQTSGQTGATLWEFSFTGNTFELLDFRDPNFAYTPVIASGLVTYNAVPSTVPVPAAAWLFGSGLIGLVGISRRKASS